MMVSEKILGAMTNWGGWFDVVAVILGDILFMVTTFE